jgi:hypothetical protein
MIYGLAWVSTDGQSLDVQVKQLPLPPEAAGFAGNLAPSVNKIRQSRGVGKLPVNVSVTSKAVMCFPH